MTFITSLTFRKIYLYDFYRYLETLQFYKKYFYTFISFSPWTVEYQYIFFFFFRPHCELIAYVKYLLYKKGLTFSVTVFEFRVWYVLAFFLSFLKQPSPSIKSTYFYTIFPRLQCNIFSHIFLTFFRKYNYEFHAKLIKKGMHFTLWRHVYTERFWTGFFFRIKG